MHISTISLAFIFFTLQATANTVARHERFSETSHDSTQRREEPITHPGLIQQRSNDSTLIPLTISLASAPSTNLTVIHAPHALTISPSISNFPPITHRILCPPNAFTISSECNAQRTGSSHAWRRFCYPNRGMLPPGVPYEVQYGSCREEELCLDGVATQGGRHYAVCVNLQGKGAGVTGSGGGLGVDGLRGEEVGAGASEREVARTIQSVVEVRRGRGFAVKIALRGDDGAKEVRAQSLSVKALLEGDGLQGGLWQTSKAISQRCGNCTQIGLASVPAQTARLSAEVHLDGDLGSVKMYVVAVEV